MYWLKDCTAWLCLVGSKVKARGTAIKSVQRECGKKRRDTDAVVKRLLSYLRSTTDSSSLSNSNDDKINSKGMDASARTSTTKEILGLNSILSFKGFHLPL